MIKNKSKWPIFVLPLLGFLLLSARPTELDNIVIDVSGVRSASGNIVICLFTKEDGFPDQEHAWKVVSAKIDGKKATGRFDHLAPGRYAISVFHDENGNGKLDRNFLGIPKEGVGASNNAKGHFGPPKFRDAAFTLSGDLQLGITVTYL